MPVSIICATCSCCWPAELPRRSSPRRWSRCVLLLDDRIELDNILMAATPLLVGDAIGIAVMTPLTLRLVDAAAGPRVAVRLFAATWPSRSRSMARSPASHSVIIVGGAGGSGLKYFYLLFVPVVLAAVRHGFDGACVALAVTQFALVGLMHRFGYDAQAFTEMQTLMLVLTGDRACGRRGCQRAQADGRAGQLAEERLREKEAEAARAARFSLVSGMASALAHEINQPMTAARALARSAQHLLESPTPDLPRGGRPISAMPSRRSITPAAWCGACAISCAAAARMSRRFDIAHDARRHDGAGAAGRNGARDRIYIDVAGRPAAGAWRPDPASAGGAESRPQRDRGDRRRVANRRPRSGIAARPVATVADRDSACATTARASRPTSPTDVRAADHLASSRDWASACRSARPSWNRMAAGSGCIRASPAPPNSASRCRLSTDLITSNDRMTPTIFVIDDQASVRHAIGEMLSVFGFTVETFEFARHFLDQVAASASRAAWSPMCACRAWTASRS